MVALSISNPTKYPLGVILSRDEPPSTDPKTFLRDGAGNLINGQQIYSPLNPQWVLDSMAELRARPLRALRQKVPINMILNGGEYGLGVVGDTNRFAWDPAVSAAQAASGLDWVSFISKAKKREMDTIAAAVRAAVPDRSLYIYYQTGPADRGRYWGWRNWGPDPEDALDGTDLPSTEYYYKQFNDGYLVGGPNGGHNDMLSRALNSDGFAIGQGKKYSYDWLWAGFTDEGADPGGNLPPGGTPAPYVPDASIVDPNSGGRSPINLYTGFLKCIFTAGTLGGNAGYYYLPLGGFNGSFPADQPKYYLPQMTSLSHVQALFSYLETDVRNSDLLPGPNVHAKSTDQPAYEFPTGYADTRVLARKVTGQNRWIITAWAADGVDRTVRVSIPVLGNIALSARSVGSVYIATIVNNQMQLTLTDSNGLTPTVGGYAPVDVTPTLTSNPNPVFVNGGFETPVLSDGGSVYGSAAGSVWSLTLHGGIQRNGSGFGATNAPEGSQTAYLQANSGDLGSISQVVNFSAGTYKVTFQAARRSGQLQPLQIKIDGVNVGSTITPSSDSFALYTSADFTVIAGKHEITLAATDATSDKTSFVDDVRIVNVAPASTLTSFLTTLYTGTRNNFTGNVGYEFTPTSNLSITALGRPVSGSMNSNHDIKIWRVSDQSLLATATVTPSSTTDSLGYKYSNLSAALALINGVPYRITSNETAGGDAWMDAGSISNHKTTATVNGGVWASGAAYPATVETGANTGYVPPTFYADVPVTPVGTSFLQVLYTGTRNNFTGNVGYEFTPTSDLSITALGRPVSGSMLNNHAIKIWRVSDQSLLATATVTPSSPTDSLGYKYTNLGAALALISGVPYRITSNETAGGDAWMDAGTIANHKTTASVNNSVWVAGDAYPLTAQTGTNTGYVPPTFYSAEPAPPPSPLVGTSFLTTLYTGTRNNFTGNLGYQFTPTANLSVTALGRPVSGSMLNNHAIKIWRVSDQSLLATATVTPSSPTDSLGYKYTNLSSALALTSGVPYRITSNETAGGDAWMDAGTIANHKTTTSVNNSVWVAGDAYPLTVQTGTNTGYVPPTFYTAP